jgi:hypothetical protein
MADRRRGSWLARVLGGTVQQETEPLSEDDLTRRCACRRRWGSPSAPVDAPAFCVPSRQGSSTSLDARRRQSLEQAALR